MIKEKIKAGMIFKSYRSLCSFLDEEIKAGNSKKSQIKEWERFFKFHKDGNKFIIDEVYNEPKEKEDGRKGRISSTYYNISSFNVPYEQKNNHGIYKIVLDNSIYIGSTINNFRKRFLQHYKYNKDMPETRELLENGGVFEVIHDMTNITDELLIRMLEEEFIKYYMELEDYIVVNKRDKTYSLYSTNSEKTKYKTIRIKVKKDEYWNTLMELNKLGLIDISEYLDEEDDKDESYENKNK